MVHQLLAFVTRGNVGSAFKGGGLCLISTSEAGANSEMPQIRSESHSETARASFAAHSSLKARAYRFRRKIGDRVLLYWK